MRGSDEIVPSGVRQSAIISHSIGVEDLDRLLEKIPGSSDIQAYQRAVTEENVLALATDLGRRKRFGSLKKLYLLRPDSILFRALRDLWPVEKAARPLLATLCALATDTVFRHSASVVLDAAQGEEVGVTAFREALEERYAEVYAGSTLQKAADNAYASWQQAGHLGQPESGVKRRQQPICRPADVAYALLLGHLQNLRGEALFTTLWTQVLDQPRSQLYDLAFAASQRGMIEYRNAGGVVEVGFRELLRPLEGELL